MGSIPLFQDTAVNLRKKFPTYTSVKTSRCSRLLYYHGENFMMSKYFGSLEDCCFLLFITVSFSQGKTEIWGDCFSHLAILISKATVFNNLFRTFFHFWKNFIFLKKKKYIYVKLIKPYILIYPIKPYILI